MFADSPAVARTLSLSDFLNAEFIGRLENRFFHIFLTEQFQRILEVRGCEVECHATSLVRIDLSEFIHRG
jgi:hypothetical protein